MKTPRSPALILSTTVALAVACNNTVQGVQGDNDTPSEDGDMGGDVGDGDLGDGDGDDDAGDGDNDMPTGGSSGSMGDGDGDMPTGGALGMGGFPEPEPTRWITTGDAYQLENVEVRMIAAAPTGSYVLYDYEQTIDIDDELFRSQGPSSEDRLLVRYDDVGEIVWGAPLAMPYERSSEGFMKACPNDDVIVHVNADVGVSFFGQFLPTSDEGEPRKQMLLRIAQDGTLVWSQRTPDLGWVQIDCTETRVVMAATVTQWGEDLTFGATTIEPTSSDVILVEVAADTGQLTLLQHLEQGNSELSYGVALNAAGEILLAHTVRNGQTVATTTMPANGKAISKFQANGTPIWSTFITAESQSAGGFGIDATGASYAIGGANQNSRAYFTGTAEQVSAGGSWQTNYIARVLPDGTPDWVHVVSGTSNGNSHGIETRSVDVDDDGNVYFGGDFFGTGTFEGLTIDPDDSEEAWRRAYIAKYDTDGVLSMAVGSTSDFDSETMAVSVWGDRVMWGGVHEDTFQMGTTISSSLGEDVAFVFQLNPDGTQDWSRFAEGTGAFYMEPEGIAVDSHGNVYVGGDQRYRAQIQGELLGNSTDDNQLAVFKLDDQGQILWTLSNELTGDSVHCDRMVMGPNERLYISCETETETMFGPMGTGVTGEEMSVVSVITPDGAFEKLVWATSADGGVSADHVSVDGAGNIYLAGTLRPDWDADSVTASFGTTDLTATADTAYVARYDIDEDQWDWARLLESDGDTDVDVLLALPDGSVFLAVDQESGTSLDLGGVIGDRYAFAKLGADNSVAWVSTATGPSTVYPRQADVDEEGNIYVAGHYREDVSFDGTALPTVSEESDGDAWMVRYSSTGTMDWAREVSGGSSTTLTAARVARGVLYVGGDYESDGAAIGVWTFALDDGEQLSLDVAYGDGANIEDMHVTEEDFYLLGRTSRPLTIGNRSITPLSSNDLFVARNLPSH